MKYKTLAELKAAYNSGEISKQHSVNIDNNDTTVYAPDQDSHWRVVFDGRKPQELLKEALDSLGVPYSYRL